MAKASFPKRPAVTVARIVWFIFLAGVAAALVSQRSHWPMIGSSAAVSESLRPMASAAQAPPCSLTWRARPAPMPCEATPIATPRMDGSFNLSAANK